MEEYGHLATQLPNVYTRRDVLRIFGLGAASVLLAGCTTSTRSDDADIHIDFSETIQPIDDLSFGSTITTYNGDGSGSSITRSDAWTGNLEQLGLPAYRLPLRYDTETGKIFSSAAGAQTEPGEEYVRSIVQGLGAKVVPVIGGLASDNDFSPEEVRGTLESVERIQGYPSNTVILGNEPIAKGETDLYISRLMSWITAAREVNPDISISIASMHDMKQGGADLERIVATAAVENSRMGVHAYQGESAGLSNTDEYCTVVDQLRHDYRIPVDVEEFNWAPFAGSGTFFGPENVVFTSSVIGHVLAAGGRAYNYGDSNGPLGLMNDGSGKDNQPGGFGQPFPSYHGLGMLTGYRGKFRGLGSELVEASSSIDGIEVFATENAKIVLLNKTDRSVTVRVSMGGVAPTGAYNVWQTDRSSPLEMPGQITTDTAYRDGRLTIELPSTTVSSVEI